MPFPALPPQWDAETFEIRVKEFLEGLGRRLKKFETYHRKSIGGSDGEPSMGSGPRYCITADRSPSLLRSQAPLERPVSERH